MKRLIIVLYILSTATSISYGQDYTLDDFHGINVPERESNLWYELNRSDHEFKVSFNEGLLKISKAEHVSEVRLELENGLLIGTNHGEFGGSLDFIPKGTKKKQQIARANARFIFRLKNEIYFIDGLAHLSYSGGNMYRLDNRKGKFIPIEVMKFDDAPEAMAIHGDSILIAAHESFFIIHGSKKEKIVKETFWTSLYPNSVAVADQENVYIGHRGGFTKMNIRTREMKFFRFSR